MNKRIDDLVQRVKELEKELSLEWESELTEIREHLNSTIEQGKVRFQKQALAAQ